MLRWSYNRNRKWCRTPLAPRINDSERWFSESDVRRGRLWVSSERRGCRLNQSLSVEDHCTMLTQLHSRHTSKKCLQAVAQSARDSFADSPRPPPPWQQVNKCNDIIPLKPKSSDYYTLPYRCNLAYHFLFLTLGHSGRALWRSALALSLERQSAQMSEIKNDRLGLYGAEHSKCDCMWSFNPLKGRGVNVNFTLCHPGIIYIFNFWRSGTLALSSEHQSARTANRNNKRAPECLNIIN